MSVTIACRYRLCRLSRNPLVNLRVRLRRAASVLPLPERTMSVLLVVCPSPAAAAAGLRWMKCGPGLQQAQRELVLLEDRRPALDHPGLAELPLPLGRHVGVEVPPV